MESCSDYGTRLQHAMDLAKVDVRAVAKALGVSYTAVKKVLDGKSTMLKSHHNVHAARFLHVDPDWLAIVGAGTGAADGIGRQQDVVRRCLAGHKYSILN